MSLDKILGKMQVQIEELAPTLELFIEDSIQPSVSDCDNLQAQLIKLQENIAIYKYYKQERELSPSFNIHSKVSEKNITVEPKSDDGLSKKESGHNNQEEKKSDIKETKNEKPVTKNYTPVAIGINDKFRFINELFKQNAPEYNIAIEQLNVLHSWNEAEVYLNSLKNIYNWKDNSEVVHLLYSMVKKRFM
jgi:hypothetical protein